MSAFWGPERGWLENRLSSREAEAIPFGPIKSLSQKKPTKNTARFERSDIWMAIPPFGLVLFCLVGLFSFNISIPRFDIQVTPSHSIHEESPGATLVLGRCCTLPKEAKGPEGEACTNSCLASADPQTHFSFGKYLNIMPFYLNEPTPNATRDFNLKRFPNCSKGKHV